MFGLNRSVLLVVALLLQGCGGDKLSPLGAGDKILAFGDSLTAGMGADEEQSYPRILARISGRTVINAGVSGEVTEQGLARLGPLLEKEKPQLLILFEGGNDILRNHNPDSTRDNLARMIELARTHGAEVVLIGVPQKNLFSSSAPLYGELAEQYQLPFEESVLAELLRSPAYKSDQVHLNAQGYRKLAEAIHRLLKDEGAL